MSETITLPGPIAPSSQKRRIEEIFDAAFIELLRLVPLNPQVRALILKLTGKIPGPDQITFEQIKEWAEANCEKRARPLRAHNGGRGQDDGILVSVDFSETEYGRAAYSVRCSGNADFRVAAGDLLELVREAVDAGEGIDWVVERVAEKIEEDAWNQCEPDTDASGDYDYSDHDVTGTEDSGTEYAKNDIRQAVLDFVRARHPELAAEL